MTRSRSLGEVSRRAAFAVLAAMVSIATALAAPEADDALADYLESRELTTLLIDHLEAALPKAAREERAALAERLSSLYARALESETAPGRRDSLERRARVLLDAIPEGEGFELRLNLHRGAYARAERAAERARLRLATPEEQEEAVRLLRSLVTDLTQLGAGAHRRVESLEKQEQSAPEVDSTLLRDALASARRHRSLAMYLSGWAGVYLAEFAAERAPLASASRADVGQAPAALAIDAAKRFGWLLNAAPGAAPDLGRVPDASLRLEHVARAALGVGLGASLRSDYLEATRWFDLVERADGAPEPVKDQVFGRRVVAACRASEWIDLLRIVRARRGSEEPATAPGVTALAPLEARLLAVLAFETEPPPRSTAVARKLREIALGDLVARGELQHILDLTTRFGADALASTGDGSGFIVHYVRGVQAYERARGAHKTADASPGALDAPTPDRAARVQYEDAATALRAAAGAADAERFPDARAHASMLEALAAYFGSSDVPSALVAADRFGRAATLARSDATMADARWMEARALRLAEDRARAAAQAKKAGAASPEARALADASSRRSVAEREFLTRFPADERAASLVVSRAAEGAIPRADAIESLLAVPPDSPAHGPARREAARLLFLALRDASPRDRPGAATRFLPVALALLREESDAAGRDPDAAARALLLARQILDAALGGSEAQAVHAAADEALAAARSLLASPGGSASPVLAEIDFRAVQLALLESREDDAQGVADALWNRAGAEDRFALAAARALWARAARDWRAGSQSRTVARSALVNGMRAFGAATPADDASIGALLTSAEAGAFLWRAESDAGALRAGVDLLELAARARPESEAVLRALAPLAAAADEHRLAADCWRRLASGLEVGGAPWFEARAGLLESLARADAAEARRLLVQHKALYPDLGPEPWRQRIAVVERTLADAPAPAPESRP